MNKIETYQHLIKSGLINIIIQGNALDNLKNLPDNCIDTCVTSPPYWGLRDYGTDAVTWPEISYTIFGLNIYVPSWTGHLGLEPNPEMFVSHIVLIFREVKRVLKPSATLWLNFGDSYSAASKNRSLEQALAKSTLEGRKNVNILNQINKITSNLKPKDLVGIPWMVAFALRDDGWYLRQDIIWNKKNHMPESVSDRCTKSHEYLFLLSKSLNYYFDQFAIRETASNNTHARQSRAKNGQKSNPDDKKNGIRPPKAIGIPAGIIKNNESFNLSLSELVNYKNKRSVWTVGSEAFPEAHFATYPKLLITDCIKAGSSEYGCCSVCGKPYERILKPSEDYEKYLGKGFTNHNKQLDSVNNYQEQLRGNPRPKICADYETEGWKKPCKCNSEIIPTIIMDPFSGAGTTAIVSRILNRNFIAFELKPEYIDMSNRRMIKELGLFI
jgi:DNA modification methylase